MMYRNCEMFEGYWVCRAPNGITVFVYSMFELNQFKYYNPGTTVEYVDLTNLTQAKRNSDIC